MKNSFLIVWERNLDSKKKKAIIYCDEIFIAELKSLKKAYEIISNLCCIFFLRKEECKAEIKNEDIKNNIIIYEDKRLIGYYDNKKNKWVK